MQPRTMVQIHGLPPWLTWRNASAIQPWMRTRTASGQAQGGPADASAGMQLQADERGTFAFNNVYGSWMLLHTIRSGDTLWNLSAAYYPEMAATNRMGGVHLIGNVEQNRPILGSSYDKAVPGDVILIPNQGEPAAAIPPPPPPGAQPSPGGDPVPQPGTPPDPAAPQPIDWLPEQPPPGWPATLPWPPVQVTPEPPTEPPDVPPEIPPGHPQYPPAEPPPDLPPEPPIGPPPGGWTLPPGWTQPGNGAEPIPAGAITPAPKEPEKWWTTGRIALVGGLGLGMVGLIVWGATRGAKRKRTPRRRRTTRRRRRR